MEMPRNYLLVKVKDLFRMKSNNGLDMYSFDRPGTSAEQKGEVVLLPKNLYFAEDLNDNGKIPYAGLSTRRRKVQNSLERYTGGLEVELGDTVVFSYTTTIEKENLFIFEGENYYLVRYDRIYARLRGDDVFPLNGYVFVQLDDDDGMLGDIKRPAYHPKVPGIGTVTHVGSRAKHLQGRNDPELKVNPGDRVVFKRNLSDSFEVDFYNHIGDEPLTRIHRRDIIFLNNES